MSPTVASVAFCVVAVLIVIRVNMTPANPDEQWQRREAQLKAQGIVAQRPDDWEAQVDKQRAHMIYFTLGVIVVLAFWFISSMYKYS